MSVNVRDQRPVGDAGFSLIELIVAIAVLALALAVVPGAWRLAGQAQRSTATIDRSARETAAREIIGHRLGEALATFAPDADGQSRIAFDGTAARLVFVAPSRGGPAGDGLYRYRLAIEATAGGGARVVARVAPFDPGEPEAAADVEATMHELFATPQPLAFSFFGRADLRAAPTWLATWPRSDALPELVALGPVGGTAADLIVELRLRAQR